MNRRMQIRAAVLLPCLLALLAACGGTPTKSGASAVRTTGNADQSAASALVAWSTDRNSALTLAQIERASQLAPDRADIAWLHARICAEVRGCEPEPIESRLRQLDPNNGAAWLGPLARAQSKRDAGEEQQILDGMGRAQYFDVYWTTLIVRLSPALGRNAGTQTASGQLTPLTNGMNTATDWLSRLDTSAFTAISTACDASRTRDPAAQTRCSRVAEVMQRGDTTLAEGMGLSIAQRLVPPTSLAANSIADRIATLSYQSQTAGSIIRSQLERERFSAQMLELMKKLRREQDVTVAILRWAGEPTTPTEAALR
jgi:hypothetical protein